MSFAAFLEINEKFSTSIHRLFLSIIVLDIMGNENDVTNPPPPKTNAMRGCGVH